MYEIIEQYTTMSGRTSVRVQIDADTSTFLTYDTPPPDAVVQRDAQAWELQRQLNALRELPPPVSDVEPPSTKITKLAYMERFTDAELAGIYAAAKVSPAVEVWLEKFRLAEDIDLVDPRNRTGLLAMEAAGLLAIGRTDEILG